MVCYNGMEIAKEYWRRPRTIRTSHLHGRFLEPALGKVVGVVLNQIQVEVFGEGILSLKDLRKGSRHPVQIEVAPLENIKDADRKKKFGRPHQKTMWVRVAGNREKFLGGILKGP